MACSGSAGVHGHWGEVQRCMAAVWEVQGFLQHPILPSEQVMKTPVVMHNVHRTYLIG